MADREDATVDPMQPAGPDPPVDRVIAETECPELLARHDSVLARRKIRKGSIELNRQFSAHNADK